MKIFRFEDADGFGPISNTADYLDFFKHHKGPTGFKCYREFTDTKPDWMGIRREGYFFGMVSMEALMSLLVKHEYVKELEHYGYTIKEYETDEDYLVFPDGQVMFKKAKAKKLVEKEETVL